MKQSIPRPKVEIQYKQVVSSGGIAVSAGYKCGTCTLQKTFKCFKTHNMPFVIEKNHSKEIFEEIKILLIPFRNNEEVYPSALFQDIINLAYSYCPFNKPHFLSDFQSADEEKRKEIILNSRVEDLYEHYKKIEWDKFGHLNSKFRLEKINQRYGINIDYNSKEVQTFIVHLEDGSQKKLISFNSKILNKEFERIKFEVYGETREDIQLVPFNIGEKKWYQAKYAEFLKFLANKPH